MDVKLLSRYLIFYENSKGEWEKYKYDENGNEIYWEDSTGKINDMRVVVK